jgi:glucan phosphoethanolaminetransferase (alkaline phosphatase superfamily)
MATELTPLPADTNDERIKEYIEVWKKTIDVQQHFNDLELRIRNFAITVLGAVLSGTALSLKEGLAVSLAHRRLPLAALLMLVALITWLAFYFMDRFWYHRLLYGAVAHGEKIEKRMRLVLPEIGLTQSIGAASPIKIGNWQIRTTLKMDLFYLTVAGLLLVLLVALFLMPPSEKAPEPGVTINNVMPGAATPQNNTNSATPPAGGRTAPANANAGR